MYIWRKYTPRLCEKLSAVSYRSNLHKRWERHPNMEDRPLRYGFLHDVKSGYLTVTLPPKYYMLHSGRSPEDLVKHPLTHSLITRSKGEFTKRNSFCFFTKRNKSFCFLLCWLCLNWGKSRGWLAVLIWIFGVKKWGREDKVNQ